MKPIEGITQLLIKWSDGDQEALDQLMPLVYDELRRLARSYLRRERHNHTRRLPSLPRPCRPGRQSASRSKAGSSSCASLAD
jgi:hypothetical protein